MPPISQSVVAGFIQAGKCGGTTTAKGKALEDLICYIFELVPGISITRRNAMNVFNTEEIDVAFWNERDPTGIYFLPEIILVECKNWSHPVGSAEVSWFDSKLRSRGLSYGILVTIYGITGDSNDLTAAHSIVAGALREQRRLLVVTTSELLQLPDTESLVQLIKRKLCDLAVTGTIT